MRPKGNGLIPLHDEKQEERGFFCIKLVQFLNTEAEMGTALNNLQIVFGMTEKQIEQLIIRIETIGVKQITKEALKELTEQASELLKYKVECIRESIKREPFPPYKERLHPRKHWQRKPYWLRTRSNPKKKGYH